MLVLEKPAKATSELPPVGAQFEGADTPIETEVPVDEVSVVGTAA